MTMAMLSRAVVLAGVGAAAGSALGARATETPWHDELDQVVELLETRHQAPFHAVDREAFYREVDRLRAKLEGLTPHQILLEFARLAALMGEAHTYLDLPEAGPFAVRHYPLEVRQFRDGWIAVAAHRDLEHVLGARLTRIGSMDLDTAISQLTPYVNRDNAMTLRYLMGRMLVRAEVLQAIGLADEAGSAVFEFKGRGDEQFSLRLAPAELEPADRVELGSVEAGPQPLARRSPERAYWAEHLPSTAAVYVRLRTVREMEDEPFGVFAETLQRLVARRAPERLILDLRGNIGGNARSALPLVNGLLRLQSLDRPGHFLVLIDRGTISATVVVAAWLERHGEPVFVGEPTGSRPNQYGDNRFVELAHSGARLSIATAYYQTGGPYDWRPWIAPHVAVEPASLDFARHHDPVLEAALEYEPQPPIAEQLADAWERAGQAAAIEVFEGFRDDPRNAYLETERPLRRLADAFLEQGRVEDARLVYQWNQRRYPDRARVYYGLARALHASGNRTEAATALREGLQRLTTDPSLYPGLRDRLEALFSETLEELGQRLHPPAAVVRSETWSEKRIQAILAPPTRAEIEAVRASWEEQLPTVTESRVVERGRLVRDGASFDVLVYRHQVAGETHYTAMFVPAGAPPGSLPVLVETRGVRFDYPTRRIENGPFVMSVLGDLIDDFVIVEPCLRGHALQAIKAVHRAGGDRRDSWDGAAHDVAAAVSLAISEIPAANGERVVSFGLSRGGGVALLHGIRDPRVSAVVAMSAPTDWFGLMARPEDDWAARIHQAAVTYDGPADDRSVQFYEWFLQDRAHLPGAEIRRRLIASSPLHFVAWLPPTLVHHGSRDSSIPSVNAAALNDRLVALGRPAETYQVIVHEGAGHLLHGSRAAEQTQAFLRRLLEIPARD